MELRRDIDECCSSLESNKATQRKKYCDRLYLLLENRSVIDILNRGIYSWGNVISSVQEYLRKEADKFCEQLKRTNSNPLYPSADIFLRLVKIALEEDKINISNIIGYITGCLKDNKMKKCYASSFLKFADHPILSNPKCRRKLKKHDWAGLFDCILILYQEKPDDIWVHNCLTSIIKWGLSNGFPYDVYREQFSLVIDICQRCDTLLPKRIEENTVIIANEFCKSVAKDKRKCCCHFGELVIPNFICLYERNIELKELVLSFFLLQMVLHHPDGAYETERRACAHTWTIWNKRLKEMYYMLNKEVNSYLRTRNTGAFFSKNGERETFSDKFLILFAEISRQIFNKADIDFAVAIFTSRIEGPNKRQKMDISLSSYINHLQTTKSSLWIRIVTQLLRTYPDMINGEDYVNLLKVLFSIQIESQDAGVISNANRCFAVMVDMMEKVCINGSIKKQHIESIFEDIGKNAVRAVSVNQERKSAEVLLQSLLAKKIIVFEDIQEIYVSETLNITIESVKTIMTGLETVISHMIKEDRLAIMKCILSEINFTNSTYLVKYETASVLVNLTLRQWKTNDNRCIHDAAFDDFSDIKRIYSYNAFGQIILEHNNTSINNVIESTRYDANIVSLLMETLSAFLSKIPSTTSLKLSAVVLIVNILDHLIQYNICESEQTKLIDLFKDTFMSVDMQQFRIHERSCQELREVLNYINILGCVYSEKLNGLITKIVRENTPHELLKVLVQNLNAQDCDTVSSLQPELEQAVIRILTDFCCVGDELIMCQQQLLDTLTEPDYDYQKEEDYLQVVTFLKGFKYTTPGVLSSNILDKILRILEELCSIRYEHSEDAVDIMNILHDLYPHFVKSSNTDVKETSVSLLQPFYENSENYSSDVSVGWLKCIKQLCKVDPNFIFTHWVGVNFINYIPKFLNCSCQEIRFAAIKVLIAFFTITSEEDYLKNFHVKEEIFARVYEISIKVLKAAEKLSGESKEDELISRTASVMHTFTSIMIHCPDRIIECIMALLKIATKVRLGPVSDIISAVNKTLNLENTNVLKKYVNSILERWIAEGMDINEFQFQWYNCESMSQFFVKYFDICVPLFVTNHRKEIIEAARGLSLTETDMIKRTSHTVFVQSLVQDIEHLDTEIFRRNKTLAYYTHIAGYDNLLDILRNSIDQIIPQLMNVVTDDENISELFGESVIFPIKKLTLSQLRTCITFIEHLLYRNRSLAEIFSKNLNKLQKVLLVLKSTVQESITTDERIKSLHRYIVFIKMVLETVETDSPWSAFFVRDTVYGLINLIDSSKNDHEFSLVCCRSFRSFLGEIIPSRYEIFEDFIVYTINSLKNFVNVQPAIKSVCLDIINFIIIENTRCVNRVVEKLDYFPQTPDYTEILKVYLKTKYDNKPRTLRQEIQNFLNQDNSSTREDSLIHLKKILSERKSELKDIYEDIQKCGNTSDCYKSSIVHQLVYTLANLCCSSFERLSFAAAKCLGELGPVDLKTMILKPERTAVCDKFTPLEMVTAYAIVFLTKYIVDVDTKVVKAASDALYAVLSTTEGCKIAEANINLDVGSVNKKYILPYFSAQKTASKLTVNVSQFIAKVGIEELWCPSLDIVHDVWITSLVTTILRTFSIECFLSKMTNIASLKPEFCEKLLPYIVLLLLTQKSDKIIDMLSGLFDLFFLRHWDSTASDSSGGGQIINNNKSVRCILDTVEIVRLYSSTKSRKSPLKINYLKAAKAAEFCSSYFTSLMYADLWCQERVDIIQDENKELCEQRTTMLDIIYEKESEHVGKALHSILRKACKAVGDLDALSGCGTYFLLNPQSRVEHYKENGDWDHVMMFYAQKSQLDKDNLRNLMEAFQKCCLFQVPLLCAESLDEPNYECLWRMCQWDEPKKLKVNGSGEFEKKRYLALKSLHENNNYLFEEHKRFLIECVTDNLRHMSFESSHNLYPALMQLQSIVEAEDFANSMKNGDFSRLLNKWQQQSEILKSNYQYLEPIIAQRTTILKDYLVKNESFQLKAHLIEMLFDMADLCRDEKQFKDGSMIAENLKAIISPADVSNTVRIELVDAQLSWLTGNSVVAKHILNRLPKNDEINPRLRAQALKLQGEYMSATNSSNTHTIIDDYYCKSISLMSTEKSAFSDNSEIIDTYGKLALFADKQYQQVSSYMKTDLFQRKIHHMKSSRKTASDIQKQRRRTKDEDRAAVIHNRQSNIDENEIKNIEKEQNQYLKIAIKYYLMEIDHSDSKIGIFRPMSLLLENRNNPEIIELAKQYINISSHKFIAMLPQLTPHITEVGMGDIYNEVVNEVVKRCAEEHPHHTLPLILSLVNSHRDKEYTNPSVKNSKEDGRIHAAKSLINKLKRSNNIRAYIDKLQKLSLALIELAYYTPSTTGDRKQYTVPKTLEIAKIKGFDDIPLPTCKMEIQPSKIYSKIIGVQSFATIFHLVGGINAPKKILCTGSDGRTRSILVKGRDDLRQDAVMQQVFTIMNSLLSTEKQTKSLLIRTYKVVPLSMRSGVLEWVDNSMTIGRYLVGDKGSGEVGAHVTYRPNDRKPNSCREMLVRCAGKSSVEKLSTYKKICHDFKPVFHKFFETSFPQSAIWYERRRAYVHSVATTSMCGYILGIGDRHVCNVLIDNITAEVIHIDFGIAFEQGKILPTPETVPFRLTRDIVDGMGISGVEGDFKRSCEKTMRILRQHYQTITSIVEVLLYDPLYAWTVTAAEANKRQADEDITRKSLQGSSSEEDNDINITAERALLRLREKLLGTELGHQTSVEHQVEKLIHEATDPANLCKLFVGWQPYL